MNAINKVIYFNKFVLRRCLAGAFSKSFPVKKKTVYLKQLAV